MNKVYHPPWARSGCKVVREWTDPVVPGHMVGIQYWVEFKNSKGKKIEMVKLVKWDNS